MEPSHLLTSREQRIRYVLHENAGCEWDEYICLCAARRTGTLNCLEYADERNVLSRQRKVTQHAQWKGWPWDAARTRFYADRLD
jgi:hypothetical protein